MMKNQTIIHFDQRKIKLNKSWLKKKLLLTKPFGWKIFFFQRKESNTQLFSLNGCRDRLEIWWKIAKLLILQMELHLLLLPLILMVKIILHHHVTHILPMVILFPNHKRIQLIFFHDSWLAAHLWLLLIIIKAVIIRQWSIIDFFWTNKIVFFHLIVFDWVFHNILLLLSL